MCKAGHRLVHSSILQVVSSINIWGLACHSVLNVLPCAELPDVRTSTPIVSLHRNTTTSSSSGGVILTTAAGESLTFDAVVLATHSDISLRILGDEATAQEQEVLGAIPYNTNDVYLHTDEAFMPVDKKAWASWNFLVSIQTVISRTPLRCFTLLLQQANIVEALC